MKKTEIIMLQKKKMPELQNVLAEESRALYGTLSRRQKKDITDCTRRNCLRNSGHLISLKETGISVDIRQKKENILTVYSKETASKSASATAKTMVNKNVQTASKALQQNLPVRL